MYFLKILMTSGFSHYLIDRNFSAACWLFNLQSVGLMWLLASGEQSGSAAEPGLQSTERGESSEEDLRRAAKGKQYVSSCFVEK